MWVNEGDLGDGRVLGNFTDVRSISSHCGGGVHAVIGVCLSSKRAGSTSLSEIRLNCTCYLSSPISRINRKQRKLPRMPRMLKTLRIPPISSQKVGRRCGFKFIFGHDWELQ